jgi:hypothetical protein
MPSRCVMLLLMFCKQSVKLDSRRDRCSQGQTAGPNQPFFYFLCHCHAMLHLKMDGNRKGHNDFSTKHFAAASIDAYLVTTSHIIFRAKYVCITSSLICCSINGYR